MRKELSPEDKKLITNFVVNLQDFAFVKKIGEGAYSEVFLAKHNATNEKCAIKQLFFTELKDDNLILFQTEIAELIKCRHPFCLPILGWTDNYPYSIITKYESNGSLYKYLYSKHKKKRSLSPTDLSFIMYGIAVGMEYIHSLNIIHRDLKSLNILLDQDFSPIICDFGLSRELPDNDELLTRQVGTKNWMAPELFQDKPNSKASDVYAYGMILYEMVTNRIPFDNITDFASYDKECQTLAEKLPEDTPKLLVRLIKQCLNTDYTKRPTFKTIVQELNTCQIFFKGTNLDEFKFNIKNVKKNIGILKTKSLEKSPFYSDQSIKEATENGKTKKKPMFDRLCFYQDPDFLENFNLCAKSLSDQNALMFFKKVGLIFKVDIVQLYINQILSTIKDVLKSNKSVIHYFYESDLLKLLPQPPDPHFIHTVQIIETIIEKYPNHVGIPIFTYFHSLTVYCPKIVFYFYSKILTKFSYKQAAWLTFDMYIDNAVSLIRFLEVDYLRLLYKVIITNKEYIKNEKNQIKSITSQDIIESRKSSIYKVILYSLKQEESLIIEAYRFIFEFFDDTVAIPGDIIAQHLSDPFLFKYAFLYLSKQHQIILTKTLLLKLIELIQKEEAINVSIIRPQLQNMIRANKSTAYAMVIAESYWNNPDVSSETQKLIREAIEKKFLEKYDEIREKIMEKHIQSHNQQTKK